MWETRTLVLSVRRPTSHVNSGYGEYIIVLVWLQKANHSKWGNRQTITVQPRKSAKTDTLRLFQITRHVAEGSTSDICSMILRAKKKPHSCRLGGTAWETSKRARIRQNTNGAEWRAKLLFFPKFFVPRNKSGVGKMGQALVATPKRGRPKHEWIVPLNFHYIENIE